MNNVRVIALIENVFTLIVMATLIIALYVLGAGNYSLFGLLLLLNINLIPTGNRKHPKDDVGETH